MLVLVDTNVLLRLLSPSDPDHSTTRGAVDVLVARGDRLSYSPQNLVEFWSVCTRPSGKNGFGLTAIETDSRAQLIESQFLLLPDSERVHVEWRNIVVRHGVSGVQVYDARIAAAMLVHGVSHILTFNVRDFERYTGISTFHPRVLVASDK